MRHQSTSQPKVKLFQRFRELPCQDLHRFILDNAKIIYPYNCLICLLFLQAIEIKSVFVMYWNPMGCSEKKLSKNLTQTFMAYCNVMVCQQTTLSGEAERPKVADAVIEAFLGKKYFSRADLFSPGSSSVANFHNSLLSSPCLRQYGSKSVTGTTNTSTPYILLFS